MRLNRCKIVSNPIRLQALSPTVAAKAGIERGRWRDVNGREVDAVGVYEHLRQVNVGQTHQRLPQSLSQRRLVRGQFMRFSEKLRAGDLRPLQWAAQASNLPYEILEICKNA